jgi:hypothetical protein
MATTGLGPGSETIGRFVTVAARTELFPLVPSGAQMRRRRRPLPDRSRPTAQRCSLLGIASGAVCEVARRDLYSGAESNHPRQAQCSATSPSGVGITVGLRRQQSQSTDDWCALCRTFHRKAFDQFVRQHPSAPSLHDERCHRRTKKSADVLQGRSSLR